MLFLTIFFTNLFNENIKDIKKTWKGIKTSVSLKQQNDDTIVVVEVVHSKIKFSIKSFRNFLSSEINDFFIITSTNKEEIYKIISSLNTNKSCEPSSIPTKVLHLLQDQISNHLATSVNLSFST